MKISQAIFSSIVSFFLLCFAANVSLAEPYATPMPLNKQGKEMMSYQGISEADRLKKMPQKGDIDIPAYPGSLLGMTGGSGGKWSMITLLSKDSTEKVVEWYKKNLKGWQYVPSLSTKQLNEIAVFVETDNPKISAIDAISHRQVRVSVIKDPKVDLGFEAMLGDVDEIKSRISLQLATY